MKLVNLANDSTIADSVNQAYSFLKRLKGLMFTKQLASGSGLHIKPCQSIHTFFMNYAIDVIYVDAENVVVAIEEEVAPGKVGRIYKNAVSCIELPAGTINTTETKIGNKLAFI